MTGRPYMLVLLPEYGPDKARSVLAYLIAAVEEEVS